MRTYGVPDIIVRWLTSFLCERQQRVKICDIFSDWVTLRGGMPQGTWLGPLIFIILIDDLRPGLLTHKYVDDTTVTEIIEKDSVSEIQNSTATLVEWSKLNRMNINTKKTKEMVMGSCGTEMNTLMISSTAVERVSTYKLLGVVVSSNLKWEDHVSAITSKAARRIWFLKKLKRAGASVEDLAYYYQAVIRPVMEYASPVWHSNLTKGQTKTLEDVQRRAVQIIHGNIPYDEACHLLNILPLADRRLELCRTLFQQIMRDDTHVLHYLLPPRRDTQLTGRLRSSRAHPTVYARTSHFKNSFILHGLNKFQWLHSITNLHNCFFCFSVIVRDCECMYCACVIQPTGCQSLINLCYVMLSYNS